MRALAASLATLALACARPAAPPGADDPPPGLALPAEVRPLRYALELSLLPQRDRFEGTVAIDVELARPLRRVWLHARDLAIREAAVEVAGEARPATVEAATPEGVVRLAVAVPLPAGRATLRLRFDGAWAAAGPGLARAGAGADGYAFARLGPGEARRAFPCLDDPALLAPFEVALTVPVRAIAVSSAPAAAEEALAGGLKRVRFATTAPIPAHLLALAAGPFEAREPPPLPAAGPRAAPLPVRLLWPRGGREPAAALEAARALAPIAEGWLATAFPFPRLEVVAVPSEDGRAGVAAGALVAPAGALGFDPARDDAGQPLRVGALLARGLGRQWFEGLVAPAGPDDAWIPAGLAALVERVAVEAWLPEARLDEEEARAVAAAVRRSGLPSDRPLRPAPRPPGAAWPALDAGGEVHAAAVLRAAERFAGEARLRAGLAAHLAAHARGAASTDALLDALARASEPALAPALRAQLDTPGAPLLEARAVCSGPGPRIELSAGRFRPLGSAAAPLAASLPACARFEAGGELGERCAAVERGRGALALPACPRWFLPDPGGRAWLAFALGPGDAARLREAGFAHLAAPERVAVGAAVLAGAEAGRLAFGEALETLAPLARDGAAGPALVPAEAFGEAVELVPEAARPRARAALAELYRPRLAALGLDPAAGEPPERRRLRAELARVLVLVAGDAEATRALAARGAAYADAGEGRFRPEAVSPDLAATALAAAVAQGDAAVFDALVGRLLAGLSGEERRRALAAVGAAREPALSDRALALAGEVRLPPEDRLTLLRAQAAWPETRDAAWKALQSRWAELAEALPPEEAAELPRAAERLCDAKRLADARRFLEGRVQRLPAARAAVDETLERIAACAARREAQGASAAAWVARR